MGFAGGPVTDWHYYDSIYTERYLGLLPQNEESYQESSPIHNAANLKGKLLIAHGTGDDNVHYANTLSLINETDRSGEIRRGDGFPWTRARCQRSCRAACADEPSDAVLSG